MILTSICGGSSDTQLLEEIHKRLAELEKLWPNARVVSISHDVRDRKSLEFVPYEQWTALITVRVEENGTDGNHAEAGSIAERSEGSGLVRPGDSG